MVMPATPVANFVMRQPGFALATLDGFFNAMGGQRNTGKLLHPSIGWGVREKEIVLCHAPFVQRANDHQSLFVFHHALANLGLYAAHGYFDFQRSLFSVANIDSRP